jgi:hypothetical protein
MSDDALAANYTVTDDGRSLRLAGRYGYPDTQLGYCELDREAELKSGTETVAFLDALDLLEAVSVIAEVVDPDEYRKVLRALCERAEEQR